MCLIEPMCQRKMLIFMLCILMNNKDLFDLIDLYVHRPKAEADTLLTWRPTLISLVVSVDVINTMFTDLPKRNRP